MLLTRVVITYISQLTLLLTPINLYFIILGFILYLYSPFRETVEANAGVSNQRHL